MKVQWRLMFKVQMNAGRFLQESELIWIYGMKAYSISLRGAIISTYVKELILKNPIFLL